MSLDIIDWKINSTFCLNSVQCIIQLKKVQNINIIAAKLVDLIICLAESVTKIDRTFIWYNKIGKLL